MQDSIEAEQTGSLREWAIPFAFLACMSWVVWHLPAFILDLFPPASESMQAQIGEIHQRKDITPGLAGPFGGVADWVDWIAAAVLAPLFLVLGMRGVKVAHMEFQDWRGIDRFAMFVGRVTMVMIISMTGIMLYEVFLRYAIEAPTLWANELTLWLAGFVFLCAGLYAMQQRCHIRIVLLYDIVPRNWQRAFDTIATVLICTFAFFLVYGSYKQVFLTKFLRWEMFGTAFDPPIPATIQPTILIVITLVAIQSVANLVADWNRDVPVHGPADEIDADEIEAIKRSVGAD